MTKPRTTSDGNPAVRTAWWWVAAGVLGLVLVAAGVVFDTVGMLEADASWWRAILTVPGSAVLLLAWWRLRGRVARPGVVLAIWSATVALVPPLHSRDVYSYAAQGWLVAHGLDPYVVPSGDAGQAGLLVGQHWAATTSVYPPLALELFGGVSVLFRADLWWTALGMRLPNLVAIAVLAVVLPGLARRVGVDSRTALWAGLLNPLVIVQWVGGGHNDAVMVALLAVAFLAAHDAAWRGYRGMLLGGAVTGLAMGVKQSAAVAGLAVVALAWQAALPRLEPRRRTWPALILRAGAAGAVALLVFLGISLATGLGLGWRHPTAGSPLDAVSNAPLSWLAWLARLAWPTAPQAITPLLTAVSAGLVLAALGWLAVRHGPRPPDGAGRPWTLAVGALLAFAVLGPALQPWYLTWVAPFLALAAPSPRAQRAWLVTVAAVALLPALQDVMAPPVAMAVLAVPAWLALRWLRNHDVSFLPGCAQPQTQV